MPKTIIDPPACYMFHTYNGITHMRYCPLPRDMSETAEAFVNTFGCEPMLYVPNAPEQATC